MAAMEQPVFQSGREFPASILIKLRGDWDPDAARAYLESQNFTVLESNARLGIWRVASKHPLEASVESLQSQAEVLWAEQNGLVHASDFVPDDSFYAAWQDNLHLVGLEKAWEYSSGSGVVIAMIDSGIDLDHPDLIHQIWQNTGEVPGNGLDDDHNGYVDDTQGWDFVHSDAVPQDDHSHGSHVAGIAAAETNNRTGIAGVSGGARLMALKALDQNGEGTWMDVSSAIVYSVDNGARIINMSFGSADSSQAIETAVEYAIGHGCLLVAAAGNGGTGVFYPAALPGVLAVAATDNQDLPWYVSNRGPEVELAAPGVDILSTDAYNSYKILSGTSMSTPHVSGTAALVWSLKPEYSAGQVRAVLTSTAKDVWAPGKDNLTGWGRVDAAAAVLAVAPRLYLPHIKLNRPITLHWLYLPVLFSSR